METIEEKEMKLKVLTEEYEAKKKEGQLGTAVLLLREKLQLENWLKAHKENVQEKTNERNNDVSNQYV